MSELNLHIWRLVFLAIDTRDDLKNICLISKAFNALSIPILYRSIVLRAPTPPKKLKGEMDRFDYDKECTLMEENQELSPFSLTGRLLDDANEKLRKYVREVVLERSRVSSPDHLRQFFEKHGEPDTVMAKLVEILPNLQNLVLHESVPLSEPLQDALSNHKNAPSVHLLNERGFTLLTRKMPFVQSLSTSFRVHSFSRKPQLPPSLDLNRCFKIFPNLTSLSIEANREHAGPMRGPFSVTARIEPLELADKETFPPLENLSLSGYFPMEQEWRHWKEKFLWSNLKSLSFGEIHTDDYFGPIIGHVHNLISFSISAWCGPPSDTHPDLDRFLASFDTLECLTIKGYFVSIHTVTRHSNLQRFTQHTVESSVRERPILEARDISYLGQQCPQLQFLEIDICGKDEWPGDIIQALATGFNNLDQLRLHIGLDIFQRTNWTPWGKLDPVLNYFTAYEFGQAFFRQRKLSGAPKLVTLNTGEYLRRYPRLAEPFCFEEKRAFRRFQILPPQTPGDGLGIRELGDFEDDRS
ncbi:hypothetical protein PMG11_07785 [Penicillium brasilianum]|uniref:F-box domain-containing protein n=1 Tax=Penicillium brasilianum TaxID=104259 RepID=A0A0F7TUQ5_PENBI|nr:hypothetical protein PMG11_07785 [Penicillium brasilianum]